VFSDTLDLFLFALLGIPGAIISLIVIIVGIVHLNATLSIIGAVVSFGFSYSASAYALTFVKYYFDFEYAAPYFWLTFLVIAGGNLLSAWAVWKRKSLLATVSITPFVICVLALTGFAISQLI